jgi:hypothetical protein
MTHLPIPIIDAPDRWIRGDWEEEGGKREESAVSVTLR